MCGLGCEGQGGTQGSRTQVHVRRVPASLLVPTAVHCTIHSRYPLLPSHITPRQVGLGLLAFAASVALVLYTAYTNSGEPSGDGDDKGGGSGNGGSAGGGSPPEIGDVIKVRLGPNVSCGVAEDGGVRGQRRQPEREGVTCGANMVTRVFGAPPPHLKKHLPCVSASIVLAPPRISALLAAPVTITSNPNAHTHIRTHVHTHVHTHAQVVVVHMQMLIIITRLPIDYPNAVLKFRGALNAVTGARAAPRHAHANRAHAPSSSPPTHTACT